MDYALQAVRDHKFAVIDEVCQRCDVDGFEMDFQRAPYFFRHGQRDHVTLLMTQFVRRVRTRLDQIGDEKGRQLVVAVRVPQTLEWAAMVGLDVSIWITEGLVDVVIPMHTGYLDMNARIAEYVARASGTHCKIYAGLEMNVTGLNTTEKASAAMQRAAASGYYAEGADGIQLFNYDAHSSQLPLGFEHKQVLREIGEPQRLIGKDKHYLVTRDMRRQTAEETWPPLHRVGGEMQLPSTLPAGKAFRLRFSVGDDLDAARQSEQLDSVRLVLAIKDLRLKFLDALEVQLNGAFAGQGRMAGDTIVFNDPPVRRGSNELLISQRNAAGETIRIEGADLTIQYKS